MPRSLEEHMRDGELDRLLDGGPEDPELKAHLAECPDCARRLQVNLAGQEALQDLRNSGEPGGAGCPEPEIWWKVAMGRVEDCAELLEHAGRCATCGYELRAALESMTDVVTDVVATPATKLDLPEARAELAERMAGKRRFGFWAGALAAAALLLAGTGYWVLRRLPGGGPRADKLIAQAYSEKRTLEFRVAGAAAMEQRARIELLNWNYQHALGLLEGAAALLPDDAEILEDVALAHFERGEAEGRSADFGAAAEMLGRILAKRPDDPVALFNRAVAFGKLRKYPEAIADWEHFLRVENRGGWADEARGRLGAIQEKPK